MADVQMIKMPGGFRPAYQSDADTVDRIKIGAVVNASIRQPRNPMFMRKFFAMLNFVFDYWEPDPSAVMASRYGKILNGQMPEKNFERFRKDLLILSGFRTMVVNVKNEVRYEAESISFAKMDETEFHEVYRKVFSVGWEMVLSKVKGMTPEVAENTINQMLGFD